MFSNFLYLLFFFLKNWCVANGLNTGKQYLRYIAQIEGRKFDPEGEYVKRWVPELINVPKQFIHKPWKMNETLQEQFNVRLGIDYPHPIRDPTIGDQRRRRRYLRRKGMEPIEEIERKKNEKMLKNEKKKHHEEDWYGKGDLDGNDDDDNIEDDDDDDDGSNPSKWSFDIGDDVGDDYTDPDVSNYTKSTQ
jgi:hypothetical protein